MTRREAFTSAFRRLLGIGTAAEEPEALRLYGLCHIDTNQPETRPAVERLWLRRNPAVQGGYIACLFETAEEAWRYRLTQTDPRLWPHSRLEVVSTTREELERLIAATPFPVLW